MLRSEAIRFLRNWLVHRRQCRHTAAVRVDGCFHRWIQLWRSHLRSSKIRPALAVTGVLSLLPFFQFFRGTPHQLAAIKQLEESLPAQLLEENEADWFQAWKESGYDQQIYIPAVGQQNQDWLQGVLQLSGSHGGGVLQESAHG